MEIPVARQTQLHSSIRYEILDILRGIAILGICLANFGELSLYTFQSPAVTGAMPTARVDGVIQFFQYFLIDGKFYTLFSLLFGVGFSIILSNCEKKGRNGIRVFYRRMIILAVIGMLHMILLWAGDILVLYAVVGMLLPLFRHISDKKLIVLSVTFLIFPVFIDAYSSVTEGRYSLMIPVNHATDYLHARYGIDPDNFATWLRDSTSYADIVRFNTAGFFIRCGEFIEGNRVFKVLGLFLLGLYVGRNWLYVFNEKNRSLVKKVRNYGFLVGIPASILYAWDAVNGYAAGMAGSAVIYAVSVVPMGLAYASAVYLWYYRSGSRFLKAFASPGRMALTNYIGQSAIGMVIFYGVGFALGAAMGLVWVETIALGVFIFQMGFSCLWLRYFNYGPLEWLWRMLTYGKTLKLVK